MSLIYILDEVTICSPGGIWTISCPSGKTIGILSGFFGRTDPDICRPSGEGRVDCFGNASDEQKLKSKCDGKNNCTLTATVSEYGDPCPGTRKYLSVHYVCMSK